MAHSFLAEGAVVFGVDISPPSDLFLSALNSSESNNWNFILCDLADSSKVSSFINALRQAPDVVINNAGYVHNQPILTLVEGVLEAHSSSEWNKSMGINLSSSFHLLTHASKKMINEGKKGVFINISSISAKGNLGQSAYSAAKAGINALTVVGAKELGPLGIRVAAIAPGFFDVNSTHSSVSAAILSRIKKNISVGTLGEPRHLFHAVKFVIENEYFNGKVLELDGGLNI